MNKPLFRNNQNWVNRPFTAYGECTLRETLRQATPIRLSALIR
jgi:hypothetical protein